MSGDRGYGVVDGVGDDADVLLSACSLLLVCGKNGVGEYECCSVVAVASDDCLHVVAGNDGALPADDVLLVIKIGGVANGFGRGCCYDMCR